MKQNEMIYLIFFSCVHVSYNGISFFFETILILEIEQPTFVFHRN